MSRHSNRVASIAAVILVFSLAAVIVASYFALSFPDEADYWTLSKNLVEAGTFSRDGITPSAYRPPLVAWLLVPLTSAGMTLEAARPVFVLFYALTGALAGWLLCRIFPDSWLIPPLGTAFVLSHPLYLFSAGNLYPQELLAPLLLAMIALACLQPPTRGAKLIRVVNIGALAGASVLASAPAVFAFLPVFITLLWEDWRFVRSGAVSSAWRAAAASLVMLLCVAPWIARNAKTVHPGVYLSLNSGLNLAFGNSPLTTTSSGTNVDISAYESSAGSESEFEANRRLTAAAVNNIRQAPEYYTRLYVRKLVAGFGNIVETVTHGPSRLGTLAMRGYMTLVWSGVALGLFVMIRRREFSILWVTADWSALQKLAALAIASSVLSVAGYALFFTRLRFRMPTDLPLALFGAAGWGLAQAHLFRRRTR